jgi:hypothetical protein
MQSNENECYVVAMKASSNSGSIEQSPPFVWLVLASHHHNHNLIHTIQQLCCYNRLTAEVIIVIHVGSLSSQRHYLSTPEIDKLQRHHHIPYPTILYL